jgi:hypothetical protein
MPRTYRLDYEICTLSYGKPEVQLNCVLFLPECYSDCPKRLFTFFVRMQYIVQYESNYVRLLLLLFIMCVNRNHFSYLLTYSWS